MYYKQQASTALTLATVRLFASIMLCLSSLEVVYSFSKADEANLELRSFNTFLNGFEVLGLMLIVWANETSFGCMMKDVEKASTGPL